MKKMIIILGLLVILSACGSTESEKESSSSHTASDVYAKFQNIDIQIDGEQAHIVGDANASGNEFFYLVEQGEKILKSEEAVQVDGEWDDFEIKVDIMKEMEEAEDVVIVKMYTKEEDGSIINPNYIPLDLEGQQ
jgi:maltose-binding protein MalE